MAEVIYADGLTIFKGVQHSESRENIEAKFRERSGHKTVIDYRGFRALTSFEVCDIGLSEWLLIAKIDESEIITEQYRKKRKELRSRMGQALQKQKAEPCNAMRIESKVTAVDMDEFRNMETFCTIISTIKRWLNGTRKRKTAGKSASALRVSSPSEK